MSSSEAAVLVENLGKRYYTPQRNVRVRNRVSAHLRNLGILQSDDEADYFWALKDVSFKVPRGQILGIMGQNGSGKSTLLKILTGVTPPTTGRALLRGRVGSLLEVGTGFHPDMSGRENVFMNGTLLGIPKAEIRRRFDEIVDFSGIGEFIDVPVKRYSSGMYVRLAYSVASMLHTDILILDEVLAVGDAPFQEKARASMQEIVSEGRTILFVSHHVKALSTMCDSGIVLDHGRVAYQGDVRQAIQHYLVQHMRLDALGEGLVPHADIGKSPRLYPTVVRTLHSVSLHNADGEPTAVFRTGSDMVVRIGFDNATLPFSYFTINLHNEYGDRVATVSSTHSGDVLRINPSGCVECVIRDLRLGEGTYTMMLDYGSCTGERATFDSRDCVPAAIKFQVVLHDFVKGIGVDAFQGAVHQSAWKPL